MTSAVGNGPHKAPGSAERRRTSCSARPAWLQRPPCGTVDDDVGRFRELAEAGAQKVIVRLPDLTDGASLERIARVISAFR